MSRFSVCTICLLLFLAPGLLQAADTNDIPLLIRQLGGASYDERTRAGELLWEIGEPAGALLAEAAKSDDPEISMRARELLADIAYGVRPTWPQDLRRQMRKYEQLSVEDRRVLVRRLVDTYEKDAVAFLLMRIAKGVPQDAEFAVEQLAAMEDQALWQKVLRVVREPVNKYQANLLARACRKAGTSSDIIRTLKSSHLEAGLRSALADMGVKSLRKSLDRFSYKEVAQLADEFAKAVPADARFLYLQAAAVAELNDQPRSRQLLVRAVALNPESEKLHYAAATMLGEMGRYRFAMLEWQKILEVPPEGDVYDINAHMRLAMIYAKNKMYNKAADSYEAGLKMYQDARERHGRSVGMIGTDEEGLKKVIAECRAKARALADKQGVRVKDAPTRAQVKVALEVVIKDDKFNEMREALIGTAVTVSANVKPHGFRLFEKTNASVSYDKEKKQLVVLLNNSPCTKPVACQLREGKNFVAIDSLDMRYIYRIDPNTAETKRVSSFEKDYVLRVAPSRELRGWRDVSVTVNSKKRSWDELRKGIPFDFLPEKLQLKIEGIAPDGERKRVEDIIDPLELEIEPGKTKEPTAIGLKLRVVPIEEGDDW